MPQASQHSITIVCGHYGCGKTNLALNLALEAAKTGGSVTLADVDIVNPYFRSSEYRRLLESQGVQLIAPVFAGTTLDTPTLSPALSAIFSPLSGQVIVDAGGDDVGVTALGSLAPRLQETGYQLLYVINRYRALTPPEAADLLKEVEQASRLQATGIVNNSHLGPETTLADLLAAQDFAQETARLTGLPLLYSTAPDFALRGKEPPEGFRTVQRLVRFAWE